MWRSIFALAGFVGLGLWSLPGASTSSPDSRGMFYDGGQCLSLSGGVMSGDINLSDDIAASFGDGSDFLLDYDSTAGELRLAHTTLGTLLSFDETTADMCLGDCGSTTQIRLGTTGALEGANGSPIVTWNNGGATVSSMQWDWLNNKFQIRGANQTTTCAQYGLFLDTGGATTELCWCSATDTMHCVALGAGTGPAD